MAASGNHEARQQLHASVMAMHEALDQLEADDALPTDWLLHGTEALLHVAAERFAQIRYCLEIYGRPTAPPPIALSAGA